MNDMLEVYDDDSGDLIATANSSHCPLIGDLINIGSITYEVVYRNFAIDKSMIYHAAKSVCAIRVMKAKA